MAFRLPGVRCLLLRNWYIALSGQIEMRRLSNIPELVLVESLDDLCHNPRRVLRTRTICSFP